MNVTCTSDNCPLVLNSKCVFYEGAALSNTDIATNDSIQTALQKIDAAISAHLGGGLWGAITGDIEDQDDLITYLEENYAPISNNYWKTAGDTDLTGNTDVELLFANTLNIGIGDYVNFNRTGPALVIGGDDWGDGQGGIGLTYYDGLGIDNYLFVKDGGISINISDGDTLEITSPTFNFIVGRDTLTTGIDITFSGGGVSPVGGGNSIFTGELITVTNDHSWSAVFGYGHTLNSVYNNGVMGGSGHILESGPVGTTAVFGQEHTFTGGAYKLHSLVIGLENTINTTTTGVTNSSNSNFMMGSANTISGGIISNAFVGGNLSVGSGDGVFIHGYPIAAQTTRSITASGIHAVNISANSTSQTSGHGALANYSAIIGGQDHNIPSDSPRSVILGGDAIKARATDPDQVYVPTLNIDTTPDNDDTLTQVLVRDDSTGEIKYRTDSSLGFGEILDSGTYTPTYTSNSNTDAITAHVLQYMRVGDVVTVSGRVNIDPTAATFTQIRGTLPVVSNLISTTNLAGTGGSHPNSTGLVVIFADIINNEFLLEYTSTGTTDADIYFHYTYLIQE